VASINWSLVELLADAEFHSGEEMGELLGCSRAAVWKQLQKLEGIGLPVESVKGKGYRLAFPLSLLDKDALLKALTPAAAAQLSDIHLFSSLPSTNQFLMEMDLAADNAPGAVVCLSEMQTAGRGRRGRQWVSPFGANVYLSVLWSEASGVAALEGLSLAVGVAIAEGLASLGLNEAELKWPNDVLYGLEKLCGVLLEVKGDLSGECQVVVGIGLNYAMPADFSTAIGQPWTDIRRLVDHGSETEGMPEKTQVVAAILNQLLPLLANYSRRGFAAYRELWSARNAFKGRPVVLTSGPKQITGTMEGVDDSGAVTLRVDNGVLESFSGGELSLRLL